jgi:hypothetical protein
MRPLSRLALMLLLLAPVDAFAREADLAGWGETRWGMTTAELDALFGDRLRRIDPPLVYAQATVGRMLPQAEFGGIAFRALFQMDESGRLQQVLLERRNAKATPPAFEAALTALRDRHGEADRVCGTPAAGAESSPVEREWVWALPTTTIHLSYLDYRGGILYHDPSQDIDPLVPEFETRLYARRSLPRRLLLRFHPTAREDLMNDDCRVR